MKSREQLVNRALEELGVYDFGQAPGAEEYAKIDNIVEPVLADLAERNVCPFGDPDEIEDKSFVHLGVILASYAPDGFGRKPDEAGRLAAESRLRVLYAEDLSGQPLQVDYF